MDVVIRLKKESEIIRKKIQKYKRSFGKEEFEERKMLKRELFALQKDIRGIENEIAYDLLDTSQIITGTFMGLQDKRVSKLNFDAVFVDEAGQALEPAIWSVAHFAPKLFLCTLISKNQISNQHHLLLHTNSFPAYLIA
jgi:superfamily I DNA and/or RNA helicase